MQPKPLQTILPGEQPLIIPRSTNLTESELAEKAQIQVEYAQIRHNKEVIVDFGKPAHLLDTYKHVKPTPSSSPVKDELSQHLGGELP